MAECSETTGTAAERIVLPGGEQGIGFDDLEFAPGIRKVLVPGGWMGKLYLIDPQTHAVSSISGFTTDEKYRGGHGQGITSADEGQGLLFVTDRSAKTVDVVDPQAGRILSTTPLASGPDYVRYVSPTNEVWVTEPDNDRIEVFSISQEQKSSLKHADFIPVPGGPESLIIDSARNLAYTHLWSGSTMAIGVKTKRIQSRWPNGCNASRGIALDAQKGFLFAADAGGRIALLDTRRDGKLIASADAGSGLDVIAYNARLSHVYAPAGKTATLTILGVLNEGKFSVLGTLHVAKASCCAAADDRGNVWVGDPRHGQILMFHDPFPPTPN